MKTQSDRGCAAVMIAAIVFTLAAAGVAPAQQGFFRVLSDFGGTNGAEPVGVLVQGLDGKLYGTAYSGGPNNEGTVFTIIPPADTLTTLYGFCAQANCADGAQPIGGLAQAINGDLYGVTAKGGATNQGTVFKISPGGELTTLYSFCPQGDCANGAEPDAALIQAADGDFYGTAELGGANNAGTVFKITPTGTLSTVYSFCAQYSCRDGERPYDGVIQAANGNFYGTTQYGGGTGFPCSLGCGTVFEVTPAGTLTTLHSFCLQGYPCTDGANPEAGLVQAADGNFYGSTLYNGSYRNGSGAGTVFTITPAGTLTTLHVFAGSHGGLYPSGNLVLATDGNFYGTTSYGGIDSACNNGVVGCGTVFKMTPSGTLTTLHSFDGSDGGAPEGLLQATSAAFYEAATEGGTNSLCTNDLGCGTLFGFSVGLGAFAETLPTSGKVGAIVKILGNDLTGATSVTFNGTAATFTVVSRSLITTTVPAGATSGTVQVVTPGGTLSSNVPFRVIP